MKSSTLIVTLKGGEQAAFPFELAAQCKAFAADVRKARAVEIGKKSVPVLCGVIVAQNGPGAIVLSQFNCVAEAARERAVAEGLKAAKASAEAKQK